MESESKRISVTELIYGSRTPRKDILAPFLTSHSLTFVYAPAGVGKTYLSLKLSHSVASLTPFLKWMGQEAFTTIYFDGEMGRESLANRIEAIDLGSGDSVSPERFSFVIGEDFPEGMPNLADPNEQHYYDREIIESNADVIVIDNLQSCAAPSDKYMGEIEMWKEIRKWAYRYKNKGKAVMLVDHPNAQGQLYGSTQKKNAADTVIRLSPPAVNLTGLETWDNAFELHFEKGRHMTRHEQQPLWVEVYSNEEEGMRFKCSSLFDYHVSLMSHFKKAKIADIAGALGVSYQHAAYLRSQYESFRGDGEDEG